MGNEFQLSWSRLTETCYSHIFVPLPGLLTCTFHYFRLAGINEKYDAGKGLGVWAGERMDEWIYVWGARGGCQSSPLAFQSSDDSRRGQQRLYIQSVLRCSPGWTYVNGYRRDEMYSMYGRDQLLTFRSFKKQKLKTRRADNGVGLEESDAMPLLQCRSMQEMYMLRFFSAGGGSAGRRYVTLQSRKPLVSVFQTHGVW